MMEKRVNERNSYVKSLQQLILGSKKEIESLMQELNWVEELTVSKDSEKDLVTCPVNSTHRVPSSNLHKHADVCRLRHQGYGDDSVFLPPPCGSSLGTVVIDKNLQAKIILDSAARDKTLKIGANVCGREVPQTSDRYTSDLTSDERRVIYDYVVERTAGKLPQLQEFSLPFLSEGGKTEPMTREQLFAAERDAKRRRVRYRSVKVHTKSKNYSEVMREVISNQMAAYEDWLRDNYGAKDHSLVEQLEKRDAEETVREKEEMEWLEWDFRSNPHIRWKYLLEREKRRARREGTESHDTQNKRGEKSSRNKFEDKRENKHHSEKELNTFCPERSDSYKKDRHRYSGSSLNEYEKHNKYRRGRSNYRSKNRCSSEREGRDSYEKERERSYSKDYKKHDGHRKKDKYEKDRELSYTKDYKNHYGYSRKDDYEKDRDFSYSKDYKKHDDYQARIKTERLSDEYDVSFDVEHHAKKKHKSDDKALCEERMQELSDSNTEDHHSRSSSKKTKKRKKSKKKHRHKHKKNKTERRSSEHSNTTDSSDE